jgi:broad specificity phosphatase PhoE
LAVVSCWFAQQRKVTNNNNKQVLVVRHQLSYDNPEKGAQLDLLDGTLETSAGKRLSGWNAAPLLRRGYQGAVETGRCLPDWVVEALWTVSPQLRTVQTFEGLLEGKGLSKSEVQWVQECGIMERSAGLLTGLTWDEGSAVWPELLKGKQASVFTDIHGAYPRGESLADVYVRASDALDYFTSRYDRLVVVSHELTIKAMFDHLLKGELTQQAFSHQIANGVPHCFTKAPGESLWTLES